MQCPALPAIDKVVGSCAGSSVSFGSLPASSPNVQAMHSANLTRIATMQDRMNTELQEAEARMNPPKKISPPTNPEFLAKGLAGIATAKAKLEEQKRQIYF